MLGRPMRLAGAAAQGKPFSTLDWHGQVVHVDFWATWCGPCKAELPHVKSLYEKCHGQGLRVVAVSNDQRLDKLKAYVAADPRMPWPQLFDTDAAADGLWHALCQAFKVNAIPTVSLVDSVGVYRPVTARVDADKMIPSSWPKRPTALSRDRTAGRAHRTERPGLAPRSPLFSRGMKMPERTEHTTQSRDDAVGRTPAWLAAGATVAMAGPAAQAAVRPEAFFDTAAGVPLPPEKNHPAVLTAFVPDAAATPNDTTSADALLVRLRQRIATAAT